VLVGLAAWVLAPAGIIELGKKGHKTKTSYFEVMVDGESFPVRPPKGTDAYDILTQLIADIDARPEFDANRRTDPNNPDLNAMDVTHTGGSHPLTFDVIADDTGVQNVSVVNGDAFIPPGPPVFRWWAPRFTHGNGDVTMLLATLPVASRGDPYAVVNWPPIIVSTVGKSADDVTTAIVQTLESPAYDFKVNGSGNNTYLIHKPGHYVLVVQWETTDTGVRPNGLALPPSMRHSVPTLTEWGMVALVALLAASAILLLRRRRAANTS
jgi:hypothetical protein